jgi:hypothetical protein
MIRVLVWSSWKLGGEYKGDKDCSTYEAIKEFEELGKGSLSSEMTFFDEQHMGQSLAAIYNETDHDLCHQILGTVKKTPITKMGVKSLSSTYRNVFKPFFQKS